MAEVRVDDRNRGGHTLDFDGDALTLVQNAFAQSRDHQQVRNDQYKRDYRVINNIIDMSLRDPDRANIFIPKIWSIIRTKHPRDVKAFAGSKPYIPFSSKRQEFKDAINVWEDYVDDLLEEANHYTNMSMLVLLKMVYGTAFFEATPFYEQVKEPVITQGQFGLEFGSKDTFRLRLKEKVFAPWEVFVDPYATNLEEKGGCRYVIKTQLASKRDILKLAQKGGYPGLDIEAFAEDVLDSGDGEIDTNHEGYNILTQIGLSKPQMDQDIGVLLRYESDDRYIDVWNNRVLLRDIPNPYAHGMINLSRMVHDQDAHTQDQFWGIGEVKPNEILQDMLNDLHNQAFDHYNLTIQPITYYDKNVVDSANQLVRTMGNKIGLDLENGQNIQSAILESFGNEMPGSHFNMIQMTEDRMDLTSGQFEAGRGEAATGEQTATEILKLDERQSSRQEQNIRLGESMFLTSFGKKLIDMVTMSARPDDLIESVGAQRAIQAFFINPTDLPGGYNFTFKGSARVTALAIKQRNWIQLVPMLASIGSTWPGALSQKLLDVFEEDTPDARAMIIPDAIRMQLEQAQAQQQAVIAGRGQERKQGDGNSKNNTEVGRTREVATAQRQAG